MTYNADFHHRRSIRLKGYDYSQAGAYYVTICVQGRKCLFGDIVVGQMQLNDAGRICISVWNDLPQHYQNMALGKYVVMPNHFHGIVILNGMLNGTPVGAGLSVGAGSSVGAGLKPAPTHGLSEIIRAFKTFSARKINAQNKTPGVKLWQRNFYERIIRDNDEYQYIAEYIKNNPTNWKDDKLWNE